MKPLSHKTGFFGKVNYRAISLTYMKLEDAVKLTYDEIMGCRVADGTKKTYKSAINGFIKNMSLEERNLYLKKDGYLTKPLGKELTKRLFTETKKNADGTTGLKGMASFKTAIYAYKYWHTESDRFKSEGDPSIQVSSEISALLSDLGQARGRIWAGIRASGEVDDRVGKSPISFAGYRSLAEIALLESASGSESILAHTFLTLCWNLTARASTVANILWNNISWNGDCLTVMYEKGKTNQQGTKKIPRHVYANPLDPVFCPILALGLKLCCETFVSENNLMVFPSAVSSKTLSNWLVKVTRNPKYCDRFDFSADEISTHSFRKGGATYVVGLTDGPDSDAVKLRMEHTLGGCDDVYIRREAGADKYVGRAVTGLDANSINFSILPPHFEDFGFNVDEAIPESTLEKAGNSLRAAFPFLIASVLYHWDWLVNNLPKNHPFFGSKIYLRGFDKIWGPLVMTGQFFNEKSGMRASGIPKAITTLAGIEQLVLAVRDNPKETHHLIMGSLSSAHNVQILNHKMMEDFFGSRMNSYEADMQKVLVALKVPSGQSSDKSRVLLAPTEETVVYRRFKWGGRLHDFPEGFKIPSLTSTQMWHLWLFGDSNNVNIPYRLLKGEYMPQTERSQLSKTKVVMETMREKIGLSYDEIAALGHVEAERLFNIAYLEVLGHCRFHGSMKCTNAYKHIWRMNKNSKTNLKN